MASTALIILFFRFHFLRWYLYLELCQSVPWSSISRLIEGRSAVLYLYSFQQLKMEVKLPLTGSIGILHLTYSSPLAPALVVLGACAAELVPAVPWRCEKDAPPAVCAGPPAIRRLIVARRVCLSSLNLAACTRPVLSKLWQCTNHVTLNICDKSQQQGLFCSI